MTMLAAQGAVHVPILFFAGAFALTLALLAWSQRDGPGMRAFIGVLAAAGTWALAKTGEILASGLPAKVVWAKAEYLGIASLPLAWLFFVWGYCRPHKTLGRATRWALSVVPATTVLLAFTNEWHGLIWSEVVASTASATGAVYRHGAFFWLAAGYSYALLAIGLLMLLGDSVGRPTLEERSTARRLAVGAFVPIAANVAYLVGFGPRTGGDLTPAAFALTGGIYWFWALRGGLFDVLPYARAKVLETMRDGLLVLDRDGRVMDANPALCQILDRPRSALVGQPAPAELALEHGWTAIHAGDHPERHDVYLRGEVFGVTMDAVRNASGRTIGAVVALRDVSGARRREAALRDEANRDTVTGVPNRRYFHTHAARLLGRAREDRDAFTLVLCDVDHFKRYNDRHGHLQGDQCLRAVGDILSKACRRASDFVARYGGEEFVLVFPGMDLKAAEAQLRHIFDAVREAAIVHGDSPTAPYVTISAGGVTLVPEDQTLEDVLARCDRVLYAAKERGRNRYLVCQPEDVERLPVLPAHRGAERPVMVVNRR